MSDKIIGHTPVIAVEQEKYCCAVLRERAAEGWFPGLEVWEGDVREFDPSKYAGRVDCIHAGFPCQDLSCAGKGAGLDGARSGLFFEVIRISSVVRPRYVFLENVPAILIRGLGRVLGSLVEIGYDCRWTILSAAEVGANHMRKRWWCLATDSDRSMRQKQRRSGATAEEYSAVGCGGWWSVEPAVCRVANGVPGRVDRVKGLGNAQVPLQSATAWVMLGGPLGF